MEKILKLYCHDYKIKDSKYALSRVELFVKAENDFTSEDPAVDLPRSSSRAVGQSSPGGS